jgi:carboxyl-terminal processing protease
MKPYKRPAISAWFCLALLLVACSGGKKNQPGSPSTVASSPSVGAAATASSPAPATITPSGTIVPAGTASALSPIAAAATPAPQTASRVETVKLVYDILLDRYYKPLKPDDLLDSAWSGASAAAGGGGASPKLSGDRKADWQSFAAAYDGLFAKSGKSAGTQIAFGAVQAMIRGLHDDHTYFLDPQANQQRKADEGGGNSYVGVGIAISQGAPYTVETLIAGGPAERAGVHDGDIIAAIDGTATAGLDEQALTARLRGDAGQPVRLTLKHPDGSSSDVTVTRATISTPALQWKVLDGGVGYLRLSNFADAYARFDDGHNVAETLDIALNAFERAGVKGWIVDVRGNPGGSEQTLSEMTGRFLAQGIVLDSTDRAGHVTQSPVDGHLFAVQRPLAVLIDGDSGSASELFAATLQEYGRAHLVGEKTAGSVNGALESELPDGAAIQYTVVEARTGKNHTVLDGVGVTPDQQVGGRAADILGGQSDTQFAAAKTWLLGQATKIPTLAVGTPTPSVATSATALRAKLAPYAAKSDDVPQGPARDRFGDLLLTNPNELCIGIADDCADPAALDAAAQRRGWQGGYQEYFGNGEPAPFVVEYDLYADASGAQVALSTDDYTFGLQAVQPPATLGDGTAAYAGYGPADGSDQIVWRRGRLLIIVQASVDPGQSGFASALALARTLDARIAAQGAP